MHYYILLSSWKSRREFVERYIRHARKTAWGDEAGIPGIPGVDTPPAETNSQSEDTPDEMQPMNRRQKRMMDKENRVNKKKPAKPVRRSGVNTPVETEQGSGPQGQKKRIIAKNGKVLVVDSQGDVYLEEETEDGVKQEFLLDVSYLYPNAVGPY